MVIRVTVSTPQRPRVSQILLWTSQIKRQFVLFRYLHVYSNKFGWDKKTEVQNVWSRNGFCSSNKRHCWAHTEVVSAEFILETWFLPFQNQCISHKVCTLCIGERLHGWERQRKSWLLFWKRQVWCTSEVPQASDPEYKVIIRLLMYNIKIWSVSGESPCCQRFLVWQTLLCERDCWLFWYCETVKLYATHMCAQLLSRS